MYCELISSGDQSCLNQVESLLPRKGIDRITPCLGRDLTANTECQS